MINTLGPALIAHGYVITPILPRDKRPALKGWQRGGFDAADCSRYPGYGIGFLCGIGEWPLVAVDVDTTCQGLADAFEAWCLEHLGLCAVRVGSWPKRLLVYRAAVAGWTKRATPVLEDLVGDKHRLEVLGAGQQFVGYGVHPVVGREYEWTDVWGGLEVLGGAELVALDAEAVGVALDWFVKESARWGLEPVSAPTGHGANTTGGTVEGYTAAPGPLESYTPPLGLSISEARELLKFAGDVEVLDYDAWLQVGMALHHEGRGGDEWKALWDEWSSASSKHVQETNDGRWVSFGKRTGGRPITLKWLVAAAGAAQGGAGLSASGKAEGLDGQRVMAALDDFQAYMPDHKYLYTPTGALWPASAVNASVAWPVGPKGEDVKPSVWLDKWRPVMQLTWAPGEDAVIHGRIVAEGGWMPHDGARVFNQYKPPAAPVVLSGASRDAGRWRDHLRLLYGEPGEADHIEAWFAHRVQRPQEKINHALMLGGGQGIGKDTLCEPVKAGVGPWNWAEISPSVMCGAFTAWRQSVVVRVNEIHDLGDTSRFAFYEATKTLAASPPDTLSVNIKHQREYPCLNVLGLIMTSNHKLDGIYLPPDDRRHFAAWSRVERTAFDEDFFASLWGWLGGNGTAAVVTFLRGLSIERWNPKAPPPRTEAWHQIVSASAPPERAELEDALDGIGQPVITTLEALREAVAMSDYSGLANELGDVRKRRQWVHRMSEAGYEPIRNTTAKDGLWKIASRRQVVYGRKSASAAEIRAAIEDLIAKNYG